MADSFFGLDTSYSNLNYDEGGGGPSEDEYDALNDETFGQDSETFDWELQHEQLAGELESSRRQDVGIDDTANSQLEASLSQLVLDDTDAPTSRSFGSSVWRHDQPFGAPTPVPTLKNVCTVEEIERQMRQKAPAQPQQGFGQNFFQPRFPPVILQRPPGLQAPVPLPFAPQQSVNHNMSQNLNKMITQNNQMPQPNMLQNQLGQNVNQFMQNANMGSFQNNQMGQNNMMSLPQNIQHQMAPNMLQNQMCQPNQMGTLNQLGQNVNQLGQNMNQLAQNVNQLGQNMNQVGPNMNQVGPNMNQVGPNMNQVGPNMNQIGPNMNQMGQNMNQMGQNVNQMMPNGNQFNPNMNRFPQMMGQPRMMAPPPGMGMPRQNFNQNMGQYNPNFRGPTMQSKPNDQPPMNQNILINQMLPQQINQNTQINQKQQIGPQISQPIGSQVNQPIGPMKQQIAPINQQIPPMNQQVGPINQKLGAMNQPPLGPNQPMGPSQPIGSRNQPLVPMNQQMGSMNQQMGPMNQPIVAMNQPIGGMNQPIGSMNQPIGSMNQPIGHMNNSSQNKHNHNQNVQNNEQKMQKSRVYNNSKNLTSQNLVQIIQNTHPMLQYNNSYHNASHHPMLNNRNNQLFNNNQFANNNMVNNQRHNGTYNNNSRHPVNGDDTSTHSDTDEYAGLMSQREKQWLINIQMLQLNTGTPYIHDFYYTVFLERQASKEKEGVKEAHKANQQNHPFYSGAVKQEPQQHHRERHNSNRHNSTSEDGAAPRTYVPTQFENSLGKLQCGSVTAPRKIIDVELVGGEVQSTRGSRAPSVASTTNPSEVPREVRRTKQLLLDIESLYLILLRLEELNDPLAISNALILKEREEKQKQLEQAQKEALESEQEDECNVFLRNIESVQRRPKPDSPKSEGVDKRQVVNLAVNQKPVPVKNLLDEDKEDLVNKMFMGLLHTERLPQMLTVRKGKSLVARFLSRVGASHTRLRALWSRILRALTTAARRDDGTLATLAPHYRKYIQNTTGWSAILESCSLLSESFDPARTPHALTSSFTLSCVVALVERATLLVNTPEATSNERQWSKFLKTLARALKNTTLTVAKPIQPLAETKLIYHLKQLDSRSTIEILQRGKSAPEFADITKTDVSEQLVKHLC